MERLACDQGENESSEHGDHSSDQADVKWVHMLLIYGDFEHGRVCEEENGEDVDEYDGFRSVSC